MSRRSLVPSLQDQLDAITARTRTLVQPDRLAISEGVAADLFATGIENRVLPVGSPAPDFALQDAQTAKPVVIAASTMTPTRIEAALRSGLWSL